MAVAANLAYRGAVAIWIFVTLIQPLVFIVVWRTVAGSGETGGYTANQFVAYFLVMMVVDHLTFIWHMWEFEWRIRTGAFSPLLMRPIHPIHNDVCENLAYKTLGLVGVLPAAVLLGAGVRRRPVRGHACSRCCRSWSPWCWPWCCASWSSGAWPWPRSG